MNPIRSIALLPLLLVAACATPVEIVDPRPDPIAELRQFQELQRVFFEKNNGPHTFDFEDQGRVTVRDITLDGFPGNTYLRCRFHYQNRTAKPIVQSWVSLDVLDKDGAVVSTQACHLIVPVPMPLERGSYISNELRTPTYGAHLEEGWSWRIRCLADPVEDDEPLDPPAPERILRQPPPMQIKDRSWPY